MCVCVWSAFVVFDLLLLLFCTNFVSWLKLFISLFHFVFCTVWNSSIYALIYKTLCISCAFFFFFSPCCVYTRILFYYQYNMISANIDRIRFVLCVNLLAAIVATTKTTTRRRAFHRMSCICLFVFAIAYLQLSCARARAHVCVCVYNFVLLDRLHSIVQT